MLQPDVAAHVDLDHIPAVRTLAVVHAFPSLQNRAQLIPVCPTLESLVFLIGNPDTKRAPGEPPATSWSCRLPIPATILHDDVSPP